MTPLFFELAAHDPLFAAEGLDLASAERALDMLEFELKKFERVLAAGSWLARLYFFLYPLSRTAVPVPMMRALLDSERSRRAYILEPSPARAALLRGAWLRAARAYAHAARAYKNLFRRVVAHEPSLARKTLHDMAGNSYTVAEVDASIELLERNARELVREAAARASGRGEVVAPWPAPQAVPPPEIPLYYQMLEELEDERLVERYDIVERHGPVGFVAAQFTGEAAAHRFVVYIGRNKHTHEPYLNIHIADRCAFLPLGGSRMGRLSPTIFKPLIDRGVRYFAQHLTWFYAMRDQQYQPELLAVVERTRRPELNHALVGAERASLFDLLLWRAIEDLRRLRQMSRLRARKGDTSYSMGYAFFTHSNPSIYFMLFNRSVWRLDPISLRGSGRTPEQERVYVSLEDIDPPLTREEMRDSVRAGIIRRQAWKEQGLDLDD